MKLKKLNIDSYKHLQNIKFDFTYPEGHSKEGEPLEKICIIGQSATGKTSILEIIRDSIIKLNSIRVINQRFFTEPYQLSFAGQIEYVYDNKQLILNKETIVKGEIEITNDLGKSGTLEKAFANGLKLLYLSSETISKTAVNVFNQSPINLLSDLSKDSKSSIRIRQDDSNYFYQFLDDINTEIWASLLYDILDYRKRFTQMASELINKGTIGDPNRLSKQYELWALQNENPLKPFANKFNPLLEKLYLEIDLVNTEYSIPIKAINKEEVIPIQGLSTGTKGLLLSMFPLWELDTQDAIILIDEPERSLFPDIQIDLVGHYRRFAPESQIIVATHSPFIASSFEPEERFILYFGKKGEVNMRRGESPIGDDPNDILSNDFNVDYYNEFGKKAYQKYLDLKTKVTQETDNEKKKQLVIEMAELGDKYNF